MFLAPVFCGGSLSIYSIYLAILAFFPYILEGYFYFTKEHEFELQIANKKIMKRNKKTIFDFWLAIKPIKTSILIHNVFLSLPFGLGAETHPDTTKKFLIRTPLENVEFGPTLLLENKKVTLYPKLSKAYLIRTLADKKFDLIKVTLTIESETDILKLGFWSIFYKTRQYRKQKVINISLNNRRQEFKA